MDLFSGAVGGLIGAIVGAIIAGQYTLRGARLTFNLDLDARRTHEEASRQEEMQRVRTLLRLEMERNLEVLEEFWLKVTQLPVIEGGGTETGLQKRLRLVQLSLPQWEHLMWTSQAAQLPSALDEDQIKQMYTVHADLDLFRALRTAIDDTLRTKPYLTLVYNYNAFKADQRNASASGRALSFGEVKDLDATATDFNKDTEAMWFECDRIHGEVSQQCHALTLALCQQLATPQPTAPTGQWNARLGARCLRWPLWDRKA
jgi:hypothetical protein